MSTCDPGVGGSISSLFTTHDRSAYAGLGGPGGFNGGSGANGIVSTTGGVGVGPGGGAPGFAANNNGQSAGGAGFALA
jgi:hypothetical protein